MFYRCFILRCLPHTAKQRLFFRNITPMLGEDRFFDEFSLRFLTTYHSHAAWRSFWPYFSFVLQRFFQETLTPLEVFAWNITPMQHGAHFFNDISATGAYNTKPTIQTYNTNLQYKSRNQTCNTNLQYKPTTQNLQYKTYSTNLQCKTYNTNLQYTPCNTDLQCKPAIHTYNRNLQYKPTTQPQNKTYIEIWIKEDLEEASKLVNSSLLGHD